MSSINQTSVPKLELTSSGISLPEEGDVLNGVIQNFTNAFGKNIKFYNANGSFLLSTPQGQLASSIAAMISDRNRLLAYYINQVDPNYAVGRMQDGIGRIYFIERKRATNTTVVGRCYGAKDTVIPDGTKVKDTQGNVYQSTEQAVINKELVENVVDDNGNFVYEDDDSNTVFTHVDKDGNTVYKGEDGVNVYKYVDENGNTVYKDKEGNIVSWTLTHKTKTTTYADVAFECLEKGVITCPAGSLTERYQVIAGWESVNNLNDGTVGIADESQAQFEQRRRQSVAQNSLNSVDSIMAALLTLEEVDDAFVIEKYEDTYSYTVEDKTNEFLSTLKSHSIYACVALKIPENEQIIFDADGAKDPNNQLSVSEKIARTIWRKKNARLCIKWCCASLC